MPQIIAFIQTLEDKGHAYSVDGDVFFDVVKDPNYGQLSNRSVDDQQGEGGEAAAKLVRDLAARLEIPLSDTP